MANYTIEGRAGSVIKDVQREWMWQLTIPGILPFIDTGKLDLGSGGIEDEITIRARNVSMPSRGVETIESVWMSQKQFFPGKPTFGNTVSVQFEESENQNVSKMLWMWQENIMSIRSGHSNKLGKRNVSSSLSYVTDMYLNLVNYSGELAKNQKNGKFIHFKNVFPQNVGDVSLSYDSAGSVKFDVTFQFDWWYLRDSSETLTSL